MKSMWIWITPIALLVLISSCDSGPDQRLVNVAMESATRQAEQNKQMVDLHKQVAEGSRKLVDADAQARQELVELQRDLRSDQAEVGRQRDALESERRVIAKERYWDGILGTALYSGAGLLACLLPLLLCGWMLHAVRDKQGTDEALAELLVQERVTDRPLLLPPLQPVPLLGHQPSAASSSTPGSDAEAPTTSG